LLITIIRRHRRRKRAIPVLCSALDDILSQTANAIVYSMPAFAGMTSVGIAKANRTSHPEMPVDLAAIRLRAQFQPLNLTCIPALA
jgi:hypothetical protein